MGWGGAITDAETILTPVYRSDDKPSGAGYYNYGRSRNPEVRSTRGRVLDRGRSRQARAADPGRAAGVP